MLDVVVWLFGDSERPAEVHRAGFAGVARAPHALPRRRHLPPPLEQRQDAAPEHRARHRQAQLLHPGRLRRRLRCVCVDRPRRGSTLSVCANVTQVAHVRASVVPVAHVCASVTPVVHVRASVASTLRFYQTIVVHGLSELHTIVMNL